MRLKNFEGFRPFNRSTAVPDVFAELTLALMNIPQVLGYTRIAGTPVVFGLYTMLLPPIAFAVFGSSDGDSRLGDGGDPFKFTFSNGGARR